MVLINAKMNLLFWQSEKIIWQFMGGYYSSCCCVKPLLTILLLHMKYYNLIEKFDKNSLSNLLVILIFKNFWTGLLVKLYFLWLKILLKDQIDENVDRFLKNIIFLQLLSLQTVEKLYSNIINCLIDHIYL